MKKHLKAHCFFSLGFWLLQNKVFATPEGVFSAKIAMSLESKNTVDARDGSLWITRQVQRVSDDALSVLPKNEVIRVFPKQVSLSKSGLILKGPKTEKSHAKIFSH